MAITDKHAEHVCKYGCGYQQCKYLEDNRSGFVCLKKSPMRDIIEEDYEDEVRRLAKGRKTPKSEGLPSGDNCPGYYPFKNLPQGYDVDS